MLTQKYCPSELIWNCWFCYNSTSFGKSLFWDSSHHKVKSQDYGDDGQLWVMEYVLHTSINYRQDHWISKQHQCYLQSSWIRWSSTLLVPPLTTAHSSPSAVALLLCTSSAESRKSGKGCPHQVICAVWHPRDAKVELFTHDHHVPQLQCCHCPYPTQSHTHKLVHSLTIHTSTFSSTLNLSQEPEHTDICRLTPFAYVVVLVCLPHTCSSLIQWVGTDSLPNVYEKNIPSIRTQPLGGYII